MPLLLTHLTACRLPQAKMQVGVLEAGRAEAEARVVQRVTQRQMLDIKRFIVEDGPKQPLNLKW